MSSLLLELLPASSSMHETAFQIKHCAQSSQVPLCHAVKSSLQPQRPIRPAQMLCNPILVPLATPIHSCASSALGVLLCHWAVLAHSVLLPRRLLS